MTALATPTIRQTLNQAVPLLRAAGLDSPRLEAELLLAHILGCERPWLHAHDDETLTPGQLETFRGLLDRRRARAPLAYLTGHKEFFGLDFEVSPAVLIPRPETELLVERALQEIRERAAGAAGGTRPLSVVDAGSGSGCIAVALAVHAPGARVVAVDLAAEALAVARRNARRHAVAGRIAFLQGDLLAPLSGPVDLVVSNPPYVSPGELRAAMPEVADYEPRLALDGGGPEGLDIVRRLLAMLPPRLRPGGAFFIEIGAGQGAAVRQMARRLIPGARLAVEPDLAGRDRLLVGHI